MSLPFARPRTVRSAPGSWMTALALFALVLTGCGPTSAPTSSTPAETAGQPSAAASTVAASPTAGATASAAAEVCLPAEIITALEESANGTFGSETPLTEVADALEALDFSRSGQDARWVTDAEFFRDDLVKNLRATDSSPLQLGFAVAVFRLEVLPEISEC